MVESTISFCWIFLLKLQSESYTRKHSFRQWKWWNMKHHLLILVSIMTNRIISGLSAICRPCSLATVQLETMITVDKVLPLQQSVYTGRAVAALSTSFRCVCCLPSPVIVTELGLLERWFLKKFLISNVVSAAVLSKSVFMSLMFFVLQQRED